MKSVSGVFVLLALAAVADLSSAKKNYSKFQKDRVHFHVFNKANAYQQEGNTISKDVNKANILAAGLNPDVRTVVLIHGFANGVASDSMQLTKNAYLQVEDLNVVVVDWSPLNPAPLYLAGYGNMNGVAAIVAELLDEMVKEGLVTLDKVHIVGHSLGAHVAGIVAEHLTSGRISRITGLDPARPMINLKRTTGRLSEDDADLVDTIHTNAGTLGEQQRLGHVDFYANGGKKQPGCGWDLVGTCSHGRSYELLVESIINPAAFKAWLCEDEWDALHQRCASNDKTAIIGDKSTYSQEGAYYFETNDASPFSKST